MRTVLALVIALGALSGLVAAPSSASASGGTQANAAPSGGAPPAPVVGDHASPLRPVTGAGNVGISNAVLRDQEDVRVLRVVVEPGGTRVLHAHTDVTFHLFVPISGPMMLTVEGTPPVVVPPWQPFYMKTGTRHTFQNTGSVPVEIMEVFIKEPRKR
jgi:mannose-6-phosphate isomerase-like protein (cupin superfamily)